MRERGGGGTCDLVLDLGLLLNPPPPPPPGKSPRMSHGAKAMKSYRGINRYRAQRLSSGHSQGPGCAKAEAELCLGFSRLGGGRSGAEAELCLGFRRSGGGRSGAEAELCLGFSRLGGGR